MDETAPPKLHDSLNLAVWGKEIKAIKNQQQVNPKYRRYYGLALMGLLGAFLLTIVIGKFSTALRFTSVNLIYLLIGVIGFAYGAYLMIAAFRRNQIFAKRFNSYAPSFVPRANLYDLVRLIGILPLL